MHCWPTPKALPWGEFQRPSRGMYEVDGEAVSLPELLVTPER